MSDHVRPEMKALDELEFLLRNVGEELATMRRRAQGAEARLKSIGTTGSSADASAEERVAALEEENAELRRRLKQAGDRTRAMLDRVRFLRQQHVMGGEG